MSMTPTGFCVGTHGVEASSQRATAGARYKFNNISSFRVPLTPTTESYYR